MNCKDYIWKIKYKTFALQLWCKSIKNIGHLTFAEDQIPLATNFHQAPL